MPKINWNAVEEQDFTPIVEGRYSVQIEEVRTTQKDHPDQPLVTKNGDEMWVLKLNILGPKYAGRKLFTNLVFNDGGYGNIKRLYSVIFGTKLPKNCEPTDILDEKIDVDVVITEYNGRQSNSIPYAGFYKSTQEDEEEFI